MRSRQYADALPALSPSRDGALTREIKNYFLTHYFLKSRANASRASLAFRGAAVLIEGAGGFGGMPFPFEALVPSRDTVTRGANNVQGFAWSFDGMRSGIGFKH